MNAKSVVQSYSKTWDIFLENLQNFKNVISESKIQNMQEILNELYFIPKEKLIMLIKNDSLDKSKVNIGSVTGFFFEYLIRIFLETQIMSQLPSNEYIFESNYCHIPNVKRICRDPDFHIYNLKTKKSVVVEVKVAPNKNDLYSIINLRKKCISQDLGFYFIGGWVTASTEQLKLFIDKRWACFLDGSKRNKEKVLPKLASFDEVFRDIYKELL